MITWQLRSDGRCPPGLTMKKDLELFEAVRLGSISGILRIYNWTEPALTTGFHQESFAVNDPFLDIPIIRRPTGGGAVLHFDDITFSISTPQIGAFSGGILECSGNITHVMKSTFRGCGIETEAKGGRHAFSPICFLRPSPAELMIGENKIMGLALAKKEGFLLMQGVIPLRVDQELSERVFGNGLKNSVKGVLDYFPDFSEDLFFQSLIESFVSHLGILLDEGNKDDYEYHRTDERKIESRRKEVCKDHVPYQ